MSKDELIYHNINIMVIFVLFCSPLCSRSFSEPSFGHFNKDGLLDVVVEEDIGNYTKRVTLKCSNTAVSNSSAQLLSSGDYFWMMYLSLSCIQVIILDGKSGVLLWEVNLLASPNSPRPASIHTTNMFSVFMFWGMMPSETNSSVSVLSL